ncbi:hypothetical protein EDD86DRAFT_207025 [Gorgonomyces haynaldii]|nr:hypothetical protein EDD86DRAFT_207025 [Gorgonomyces haynaldii]
MRQDRRFMIPIFNQMVTQGIKPTLDTYALLMRRIDFSRHSNIVGQLLESTLYFGLVPDQHYFKSFLQLQVRNRMDDALGLLKRMEEFSIKPDADCYSIIMHQFAHTLDQASLFATYQKQLEEDIQPNFKTVGAFLHYHAMNGDWKGLQQTKRDFTRILKTVPSGIHIERQELQCLVNQDRMDEAMQYTMRKHLDPEKALIVIRKLASEDLKQCYRMIHKIPVESVQYEEGLDLLLSGHIKNASIEDVERTLRLFRYHRLMPSSHTCDDLIKRYHTEQMPEQMHQVFLRNIDHSSMHALIASELIQDQQHLHMYQSYFKTTDLDSILLKLFQSTKRRANPELWRRLIEYFNHKNPHISKRILLRMIQKGMVDKKLVYSVGKALDFKRSYGLYHIPWGSRLLSLFGEQPVQDNLVSLKSGLLDPHKPVESKRLSIESIMSMELEILQALACLYCDASLETFRLTDLKKYLTHQKINDMPEHIYSFFQRCAILMDDKTILRQ